MTRLEQDRAAALEASRVSQAKAKHTPGPWRATEKTITAPETEDRLGMECRLYGGNGSDNRANARLIAGAPEMLEALKAYEAWADKTICKDVELSGIRKQIRAAIARATGEQP